MSIRTRRPSAARSPDLLLPILTAVKAAAPNLSAATARRVAEMAQAMKDAAAAFEGCEDAHLVEAGFWRHEITMGKHLALHALRTVEDADLPEDAVDPFSLADATALRRFNASLATAHPFGAMA